MKRIGKAAALLGVILALAGCHHARRPQGTASEAAVQVNVSASKPVASLPKPVVTPPVARGCKKPTPTSAQGFAKMFAALPTKQWGAADVSISAPLADGRVLWLYGDTFSDGRFVHSSAIVQDHGCLHVVNGGAQLLPNIDAKHIYWIAAAGTASAAEPDRILIMARAVTLTGTGPWDFKDGGFYQEMSLWIDGKGDAAFTLPAKYGWALVSPLGPGLDSAAPNPGPMYSYGPHHFGYARHSHPEFKLASGKRLYTTCQNWDDGKKHTLADYRPIFTER